MKLGIYTYGNLGRGLELAIRDSSEHELVGIFTRRDPKGILTECSDTCVFSVDDVLDFRGKIDVLLIAGGSATDLPVMSPMLAGEFNIIDSFDNHSHVNEHFSACDKAACDGSHVALISCGWDPGIFSLFRLFSASLGADAYSFWGKGISQGHSDAIRRIKGVIDAVEYTVPNEAAISLASDGKGDRVSVYDMHRRVCYVALYDGIDPEVIREKIVNMPDYFFGYKTDVNFVRPEAIAEMRRKMSHGGRVIAGGYSGKARENSYFAELSLQLDSNPEFTAKMMLSYASAVYRMYLRGSYGAKSVFDIPLSFLSSEDAVYQRTKYL